MLRIVFTGGGTAGHVTPNLAIIQRLRELYSELDIHYIGSADGIERNIIAPIPDVTYHFVRTGKLRRYFSMKNFTDPFRVLAGCHDARVLMKEIKPDVVFSKGGFVAVPVVYAAGKRHIPVIAHESDITPGLANKISMRYADKICVTFPDTLKNLPEGKGIFTGTPIRTELYKGDSIQARSYLHFDAKPVLLVMGGSIGSVALNNAVRSNIDALTARYNIIHLCGNNNLSDDSLLCSNPSYRQFEFISTELADCLSLASLILSRAGSNSIHEFLALKKPMLLIPLPLSSSRGDQILNARSFEQRNYAMVLNEEDITSNSLMEAIDKLDANSVAMKCAMEVAPNSDGTDCIARMLLEYAH